MHRRSGAADEAVPWLLEAEDPLVRYRTLVDLLEVPPQAAGMEEAREAAYGRGKVPLILSRQGPEGCWGRPEDFYVRTKYHGTVWTFLLLAELGARGEGIDRAGDFVIRYAQRKDGGFTHLGSPEGGRKEELPCLTANMVYALLRTGQGDKEGTRKGIEALVQASGTDAVARCGRCRSAKVKALKALLEVPPRRRSRPVREAIEGLSEEVLDTCVAVEGPPGRAARPEWRELGFPRMWETDLLEVLGLLARTGRRDERMEGALDLILSKRGGNGRWRMEGSFNGRFIVPMERKGKESKWVTLRALVMLRDLPER